MTSAQWFVKMAPLAKPAMDVVNEGKTKFVPDRFSKTYLRWMENVHDWCISRQLWWGHRIPAFYCDDCGEMTVSKTDVCTCPKCGSKNIRQEEDVLDTWFSSALWPFSTLGWPDKTKELDYFYPTSTLVTGYDIIFFWVARMIFSGVEHMGETPFKTVYIHGLVRDAQGRKMSKSLGNGIDPLEVIDQYGADALRFTLATGNSPGNDMRFSDERVQASWNASRFIQMNLTIDKDKAVELPSDLAIEDKWIISKFNTLVADVTRNIDQYELGLAAAKLNDFIWENFCDWYIEIAKTRLQTGDENVQKVLCYVLSGAMQLLHPFMPFITEEIYVELLEAGGYLQTDPVHGGVDTTPQAAEVLFHGQRVEVSVKRQPLQDQPARGRAKAKAERPKKAEDDLLAALKALRLRLSQEQHIPAYIICTNATLLDMAARRPRTIEELLEVSGIGQAKAERFGDAFLKELEHYEQTHGRNAP